jgi:hypothetical protein
MEESIEEVQQIIRATGPVARMLLMLCKWDMERLLEKYYEDPDNPSRLMKEAGISVGAPGVLLCSVGQRRPRHGTRPPDANSRFGNSQKE